MRYSEERAQWEHTKQEEAIHGFELTNYVDMPPSLRKEIHDLYKDRASLEATTRKLREAEATLRRYRSVVEVAASTYTDAVGQEHCSLCKRLVGSACAELPCLGGLARAALAATPAPKETP